MSVLQLPTNDRIHAAREVDMENTNDSRRGLACNALLSVVSRVRVRWLLYKSKPMAERGRMSRIAHWCLLRLLWPYYRRLPEYLREHSPWRAFRLLVANYEHLRDVELPSMREIEGMALKEAAEERRLRIHAESRLLGVDQGTMEHINSVFGTDLPTTRMD